MKKAFTLVELLLVMMILGTILGMILNKKLINYRRVYMGYQKKATEDVVNATNLVLYRYPSLRDFGTLINGANWTTSINNADLNDCAGNGNEDKCIRAFYKSTLKGKLCGDTNEPACIQSVPFHTCKFTYTAYQAMPAAYIANDCTTYNHKKPSGAANNTFLQLGGDTDSPTIGIRMKNGEVIMFKARNSACSSADPDCFMVFVDMNGSKGPNLYGQDRYRFFVDYNNNVIHNTDSDLAYINPNGLSDEENAKLDEMRTIEAMCSGKTTTECIKFVSCYRKFAAIPKSQVSACQCKCHAAGGTTKCLSAHPDCEQDPNP